MAILFSGKLFQVFNLLCLGFVRGSSVGANRNLSLGLEKLYNAVFLDNSISKSLVVKGKVLDLGF